MAEKHLTDHEAPAEVLLENGSYTVMSLCDRLSSARDSDAYVSESCDPCPSYTTVPCEC